MNGSGQPGSSDGYLREVFPDIWKLKLPLDAGIDHVNVYLIRGGEGWCVFDTGMDSRAVRGIWEKALSGPLRKGIREIVVSHHHSDHLGLAAWLQEITGATVYVRPEELASARVAGLLDPRAEVVARDYFGRNGMCPADIDRAIDEIMRSFWACAIPRNTLTPERGQRMTIGRYTFEVLILGGHSVAQVALHEPSEGIFLGGDMMLEKTTSNVGLWPYGDTAPLSSYFRGIDEIASRHIRLVLPAHHEVYETDGNRPEELRTHHRKMLLRFLDRVQGEMTGFELAEAVYGKQRDIDNRILALGETLAHLQWLQGDGSVVRRDGPSISWYERGVI
jgi:glyoxylase-like metal-dependent hydrolase (beta-lactamase superfamily II)